jgi:antitoxin ParD1/3/4
MASLNVHMPPDLRDFVDQRTKKGGFSTPTEYVRHLIREDQRREAERRIEELFLEGVKSGRAKGSLEDLFKRLHKFVDERSGEKQVKRGNGKAARSHARG